MFKNQSRSTNIIIPQVAPIPSYVCQSVSQAGSHIGSNFLLQSQFRVKLLPEFIELGRIDSDEIGVIRPRQAKSDRSVARHEVPTLLPTPVSVAAPSSPGVSPGAPGVSRGATGVSPVPVSMGNMSVPPADAPSAPAAEPAPSSGDAVAEGPASAD